MVAARSNVTGNGHIFRAERNGGQPWPDLRRRNRPRCRLGGRTSGDALRASPRWRVGAGAISAVAIGSVPVGAPMQLPVCASVLLAAPERDGITDTLGTLAESGNCRRGSLHPDVGSGEQVGRVRKTTPSPPVARNHLQLFLSTKRIRRRSSYLRALFYERARLSFKINYPH